MKLPRRNFLYLAAGAAALPAVVRIASAQTYPTRAITMVVPFAPGGGASAIARILAERMRVTLGQPLIIENVGGANGSIGVGRVARSKGDDYTLVLGLLFFACREEKTFLDVYDRWNKLEHQGDEEAANRLLSRYILTGQCRGLEKLAAVRVHDYDVHMFSIDTVCLRPPNDPDCYWTGWPVVTAKDD
jgi:tripartite tricarboxylate transporter family receptor